MAALSPDELATLEAKYKANQSPAAQSAGVDSFNAVSRMRSALPGVGAPRSTTLTDATNLATAGAMDRADLGNRFGFGSPEYAQNSESPVTPAQDSGIDIGAVHERRNQILQGIDPDAPARYVSDVAPKGGGISRKAQLQHELGVLTGIAHQHALETAQGAHEDFVKQKTIDTANQVAGFFTDLGASKTQIGTPEHTQEMFERAAKYPLALGTAGVRDALKTHLAQHIAASAFTPQVDPATGLAWNGSRWVTPPIVAGQTEASKSDPTVKKFGATGNEIAVAIAKNGVESVTKGGKEIGVKVALPDGRVVAGKREELMPIVNQGIKKGAFKDAFAPEKAAAATTAPAVATPEDIRAQYKAGKLTKDQATAMLKKGHGFE